MAAKTPEVLLADASAWWDTSIIDIHPGKIAIRGYPIEELIRRVRFPDLVWLRLRGELPSRAVGILAHAREPKQSGRRIMGPVPREIPCRYSRPARRAVPAETDSAAGKHQPAAAGQTPIRPPAPARCRAATQEKAP